MYEVRKGKSFYLTLMILRHTYFIPKVTKGPRLMWFLFIFITFRLVSVITFIILPLIHLTVNIRGKTGVDISEDLSTIFGILGAFLLTVSFLILYEKWSQFFADLENCDRFGIPEDRVALRKKLNLFSVLYALYSVIGVGIYAVVASTETSYCKRFNEEHGLNEICGSFTPIVLPFDLTNGFIWSLIFGAQMFLAMVTLSGPSLVCFLLYEGVESIIPHLKLLKKYFHNVFDTPSDTERKKRLRFCVCYHNNILSLCDRLGTLGKYTSGYLCMTCALIFGCIGNMILKSKPIAGICFLMGYITGLFLVCHAGQRIADQTLSVADAVYNSKWYNGNVQIMKDIIFILARCQRPAELGALPLGAMNYALFLMIMKTSYSYLTLLNQNT